MAPVDALPADRPLEISPKLSLPQDAVLWTFAVLAIKGAGKTYDASVLAEEMVKASVPIIAIDSMGIWWGLRVGVDGHPGLPVVVFGGDHKDLLIPTKTEKGRPIVDEERLKLMVKAILEGRISAVLDTSEFSKGMQRRIVTIFVNELYHLNAPYGVRHVFIEEADLWCPQQIVGDLAASAGAIDDLVRRGGNFNLGTTLITQRSAVLNKDVLTQANCLIALRILHKLDKKAVETWVESVAHPDDPRIKKWYDSLNSLKDGEAWVWHPTPPKLFERVQFRKRETLHATREYFRQSEFEQKGVRMMDVDEFVTKFKKVFEPKPKSEVKLETRVEGAYELGRLKERIDQLPVRVDQPPVPMERPVPTGDITFQQARPTVIIEQYKPNLNIPVEILNQPTTTLGKVAVVLYNDPTHNSEWTIKRITGDMKDHAWETDGIEDAVAQLLRWEILVKRPNGLMKVDRERIKMVNRTPGITVQ